MVNHPTDRRRVLGDFRCVTVAATETPQRVAYIALRNDYSEEFASATPLAEDVCGDICVKRLLKGKRGHWGCLEHPQLSLMLRADHNTMMQLRTHRHFTFDFQSMRYTGERMERLADGDLQVEDVFYVRPPGHYHDRQGDPYEWTEEQKSLMQLECSRTADAYAKLRRGGASEEQARGVLATNYYQNGMISGSLRAWLHLFDVRLKADTQLECRALMDLAAARVRNWAPEVYDWWACNRKGKAELAP